MASVCHEYLRMQEEYTQKFGRAVVLMQIGSFHEVMEWIAVKANDSSQEERDQQKVIGYATDVSILFNRVLTSKNKSLPHSRTNLFMTGFPCISLDAISVTLARG